MPDRVKIGPRRVIATSRGLEIDIFFSILRGGGLVPKEYTGEPQVLKYNILFFDIFLRFQKTSDIWGLKVKFLMI